MKWARAAAGISTSLIVFASVAFLATFLLGPGRPTGAAVGNAAAIAAFAFVCWIPVVLLVAAAEGLWRWRSGRKSQPYSNAAGVASAAMSRLITNAFFSGKVDTGACAALAEFIMTKPELRSDFPETASKAEIAAQLENAVTEALQEPEVKEGRSEFDDAMQALWKVTGGPRKKDWWNL